MTLSHNGRGSAPRNSARADAQSMGTTDGSKGERPDNLSHCLGPRSSWSLDSNALDSYEGSMAMSILAHCPALSAQDEATRVTWTASVVGNGLETLGSEHMERGVGRPWPGMAQPH